MAIYRGLGGSGTTSDTAALDEITINAQEAAQSATDAASSASAASTSETNAASSASSASTSATNAATSETNSANSATAAANSATASSNSATASETSYQNTLAIYGDTQDVANAVAAALAAQTGAETAETNASNSAIAANASANDAATSEAKAQEWASSTDFVADGEFSYWSAKTAANAAKTFASHPEDSQYSVQTGPLVGISGYSALHYAAKADDSATAASTSASAASTSESNAASSATASANSATASAASATSAANSAAAAAASLDNFDDRYLGAKASDPSVDNDGNPLVTGALYFNTTDTVMKIWDGSSWIAAASAQVAAFNKYFYTATAGQTVFTGADDNTNVLALTVGTEIVILNGVVLESGADYTSTSTAVTLTSGATVGDELNILAFGSFQVADTVSASAGGTFQSNISVSGNVDATTFTQGGQPLEAGAKEGIFWENSQTISSNYTITSGKNAGTFGPVTIADGVTVTIPDGSTWTVV
jgi:hypothetical protein